MSDEKIEGIGEQKKSMQDIIDMMQAQIQVAGSVTASSSVEAPTGKPVDPGLRMVDGTKKGVIATANAGNAPISLDPPSANKASPERVVALLQADADSLSRVESQKRQEENAVAFEKKYAGQKKLIWNEVEKNKDADGEAASTKVFRWVGVAAAIAGALIASFATGGAAVGLIVGAAMALATAIAEESGGVKAMEKAISQALQKNNGMSKKEADAAAGYISQAVMTAVQMVGTLGAGAATTATENAAKEVAKVGMNVAAKSAVGNMATKAAETAVKTAESAVKTAQETLKGAQEALKAAKDVGGEVLKTAENAVKDAEKALESAQKSLESAQTIQSKVTDAVKNVAKETEETLKKAADEGVEITQKHAKEAVDDATRELSDKLVDGLAKNDPLRADINGMMGKVQSEATDQLTKLERYNFVQMGGKVANTILSAAQAGVGVKEDANETKKQNDIEVLQMEEEIVEEEMGDFNKKLSAEYESGNKSTKRIENLMDSVIRMIDSHEESLRETTLWA